MRPSRLSSIRPTTRPERLARDRDLKSRRGKKKSLPGKKQEDSGDLARIWDEDLCE